ncbi:DUF4765 family protein [Kitasatospora sp. NPDC059327]|uniref:DUF4765 family protein n=1 Tax=Kitasatospora sp. NPDC059327 TaxID=3346803 RepID=UPI0036BE724C
MARKIGYTVTRVATVLSLALGTGLVIGQPAFAYCAECYDPTLFHDRPEDRKPPTTGDKTREILNTVIGVLSFGPLPEFGGVDGIGGIESGGRPAGERGGSSRGGGGRDGGDGEGARRPADSNAARTSKSATGATASKPQTDPAAQKFAAQKFVEADRGPSYQIVTGDPAQSGQATATGAESQLVLDFKTLAVDTPNSAKGVTRIKTGRTQLAKDDPNYDSDSDDFDEHYRDRLPRPTAQTDVAKAVASGSDQVVTLWRGTRLDVAEGMATRGSVSGDPASPTTARPSGTDAAQQVGKGGVLPEFTTDPGVAEGFSHKNALVVIDVSAKYLSRGSGSESGWVAGKTAPAQVRVIVDRTGGSGGGKGPNGS